MRKFISAITAVALAASFNTGAITVAGATNNIRDFCRDAVDAGFFETMGECQSTINKDAVEFCKDNWEFFGFKNQGECVAYIRDAYNDFKKA